MFADIRITEPLEKVLTDRDFLEESIIGKFSTFLPVGHNIFGVRRRVISSHAIRDARKGNITDHLELGPAGVQTFAHVPLTLHITTAGTPHRVRHNFGYWHINDKDELYLQVPAVDPDNTGYSFTIMGYPVGEECDRFAWYCEQCATLLFEQVYESGRIGFDGFWKAEMDAVQRYNADPSHRRCPECGLVNPLGYCWNPSKDTPAQREARQLW